MTNTVIDYRTLFSEQTELVNNKKSQSHIGKEERLIMSRSTGENEHKWRDAVKSPTYSDRT